MATLDLSRCKTPDWSPDMQDEDSDDVTRRGRYRLSFDGTGSFDYLGDGSAPAPLIDFVDACEQHEAQGAPVVMRPSRAIPIPRAPGDGDIVSTPAQRLGSFERGCALALCAVLTAAAFHFVRESSDDSRLSMWLGPDASVGAPLLSVPVPAVLGTIVVRMPAVAASEPAPLDHAVQAGAPLKLPTMVLSARRRAGLAMRKKKTVLALQSSVVGSEAVPENPFRHE